MQDSPNNLGTVFGGATCILNILNWIRCTQRSHPAKATPPFDREFLHPPPALPTPVIVHQEVLTRKRYRNEAGSGLKKYIFRHWLVTNALGEASKTVN